jgi:hypothetical protein
MITDWKQWTNNDQHRDTVKQDKNAKRLETLKKNVNQ